MPRSFDINTTTGQLQTKAALDFETKSTYTVTVSVRDSKGSSGTADTATDNTTTVTINVGQRGRRRDGYPVAGPAPGRYRVDRHPNRPRRRGKRHRLAVGQSRYLNWRLCRHRWRNGGQLHADCRRLEGKHLKATATYTDPQGSGKSADAVSPAVQCGPDNQ